MHGITGTKKAALLQLFFKVGGEGGIMRWRAPLRGHRCAMLSRFARLEPTRVLTLPQAIAGIPNTKKSRIAAGVLFFPERLTHVDKLLVQRATSKRFNGEV